MAFFLSSLLTPLPSKFNERNTMKVYYDKDADLSLIKGKKVDVYKRQFLPFWWSHQNACPCCI